MSLLWKGFRCAGEGMCVDRMNSVQDGYSSASPPRECPVTVVSTVSFNTGLPIAKSRVSLQAKIEVRRRLCAPASRLCCLLGLDDNEAWTPCQVQDTSTPRRVSLRSSMHRESDSDPSYNCDTTSYVRYKCLPPRSHSNPYPSTHPSYPISFYENPS